MAIMPPDHTAITRENPQGFLIVHSFELEPRATSWLRTSFEHRKVMTGLFRLEGAVDSDVEIAILESIWPKECALLRSDTVRALVLDGDDLEEVEVEGGHDLDLTPVYDLLKATLSAVRQIRVHLGGGGTTLEITNGQTKIKVVTKNRMLEERVASELGRILAVVEESDKRKGRR
jgi:hypothetical protein